MTIHGDIGDERQQLGGAVAATLAASQLRGLVDEARGVAVIAEFRMRDHLLQEGEVGGDAANPELTQRAVHARDGLLGRGAPGGDLFQQRIVEPGDHRAGISGAAVETDAEPHRAAISGDAAIVRHELVFRIFGGDPALQSVAVEPDIALRRHARAGAADLLAFDQMNLRLDDVDAGDLFGHGVFDLDARIDFDEVEFAGVGIHQEFDSAGGDVVGGLGDRHRIAAQFLALRFGEIGRRRALHHLLMAALHRTVALEQMHDIAVLVAEDLHLDMAGAFHQLFEIDLVLAESGLGLALGDDHVVHELRFVADHAHAAATAAPRRLEHHRVTDLGGEFLDGLKIVRQRIGGRHHRHADRDRQIARGDLVAEPAHGVRGRADERNAGFRAGIGEFGAL